MVEFITLKVSDAYNQFGSIDPKNELLVFEYQTRTSPSGFTENSEEALTGCSQKATRS
jgi:hypothetical protein